MNARMTKKVLVTGAAGFIGFHFSQRLLDLHHEVVGLDNLNPYYDPQLKRDRLAQLEGKSGFTFKHADLENSNAIQGLFDEHRFDRVVHLAAQAGVRYSIDNPMAYIQSNIVGTMNILEACRHHQVEHLVYASSSSVYGSNTLQPFSVHQNVDHPISLYAATKKSNELMAHTYSHLYQLPTTGLRFFTVYGPWGRPDMALYKFTKAILEGKPIDVYNHGKMKRDFTYVDDIVTAMVKIMDCIPTANPSWNSDQPDPASSRSPYRIFNIGNNNPTELSEFVQAIESALGIIATKNYLPMQMGDVPSTYADVEDLKAVTGFAPSTSIHDGIQQFVTWYRNYHKE
jgi:UDP-glucuronate 4-epimerase